MAGLQRPRMKAVLTGKMADEKILGETKQNQTIKPENVAAGKHVGACPEEFGCFHFLFEKEKVGETFLTLA